MRPCMNFVKKRFPDKSLIGAEIGVLRGENALDVLQSMSNVKLLYLIDPYLVYDEWGARSKSRILDIEKIAKSKLEPFEDRVQWIHKKTEDCDVLPHPLDFIYIDGNHVYEYVKKDIEFAMKTVVSGGVIGGHDYRRGVKKAVDELDVVLYTDTVPKHTSDWWFIKK